MKLSWRWLPPPSTAEDKVIRALCCVAIGLWVILDDEPPRHRCGDSAMRIIFSTFWFYVALANLISLLRTHLAHRREKKKSRGTASN